MGAATAVPTGAASGAVGSSFGSPAYRLYVLVVLTAVYTLNFIDRNLLNVIGGPIIKEFGLDDTTYGFLNGPPFAFFYAVMGIPIAMMADRFNRVVILALCISVWSIMAALCGLAPSFVFLLIARVGVAVGEAGGTPPSNSIIGDYFKPRSRANALAIFAMGVTIGGALSNYFGGPLAGIKGATLQSWFEGAGWDWAVNLTDWSKVEGWRIAFVVTGAPGLLMALLLLLTVKEPPRGFSDPPTDKKFERANILETLKELTHKPTFWFMGVGAALTALVGYALTGFQQPMMQRLHGVDATHFAFEFGGPLAICSALGTFTGGFIVDRVSGKFDRAVSIVPAVGLLLAIPLYCYAYYLPTEQIYTVGRPLWCLGAFFHYSYIGSQYTIGQGVVSQRGRASAVAILLLMIALLGNLPGPPLTGFMSDLFMQNLINANAAGHPDIGELTAKTCRVMLTGRPGFTPGYEQVVSSLSAAQKTLCTTTYGGGLRQAMVATALIFIPAALFFFLSSLTLKKDMVSKMG